MKNLYLRLVARMASCTNLVIFSVLWLLIEFSVRPDAELEISRWSQGEAILFLPLLTNPQELLEQISRYGIEGRRIYSFVALTLEAASALLCFICLSTLLYLLTQPFQERWKNQWWKFTIAMFIIDIMANSFLLQLLSNTTDADSFLAWCFVVLNGCSHLIHWLIWILITILLSLKVKKLIQKYSSKIL